MATNPVITSQQARAITGGRAPLVPVEYEQAVTALAACCTLDESKYWSDKADALAAWARIYRNDEISRKAKMLKLHAFRRMGELAAELKPITNGKGGRQPGAVRALTDAGLTKNDAIAARRLATITESRFNKILEKPKAPSSVLQDLWVRDDNWADFVRTAQSFRGALRRTTPAKVARGIGDNARFICTARELCNEISEFLDELEQRLPKPSKK